MQGKATDADWAMIPREDIAILGMEDPQSGEEIGFVIQMAAVGRDGDGAETQPRELLHALGLGQTFSYDPVTGGLVLRIPTPTAGPLAQIPPKPSRKNYVEGEMRWLWSLLGRRVAEETYDDMADPDPVELQALDDGTFEFEPDFSDDDDPASNAVGYVGGFRVAVELETIAPMTPERVNRPRTFWPMHCPGAVTIARDAEGGAPDKVALRIVGQSQTRSLDHSSVLLGQVIGTTDPLSNGSFLSHWFGERPALAGAEFTLVTISTGPEAEALAGAKFARLKEDSEALADYVDNAAKALEADPDRPAKPISLCEIPLPLKLLK
ncbi:hypothetical protein DVR09_02275 [Erythrobacter aureus]|uniref:Uncharacterized protein n=2 Tax=Erythrobacter aureus TaxID=2182384 RepID=A0A345YBK6_9SPHN|nr:hypothetical protein DVR09_02275 [Erythrobacter aureus]